MKTNTFDAGKTKYGYCLATVPASEWADIETLDGYIGIFHNDPKRESHPVDEDVSEVLFEKEFYFADENYLEIPAGRKQELFNFIATNDILKNLVQYSQELQVEMADGEGVYDFDFDKVKV